MTFGKKGCFFIFSGDLLIPGQKSAQRVLQKLCQLLWREGEHILNISCYNVYNHKNPYMVYVDGNDLIGVSLFPIIPSISYTFKF